jgi:hypothetical protein
MVDPKKMVEKSKEIEKKFLKKKLPFEQSNFSWRKITAQIKNDIFDFSPEERKRILEILSWRKTMPIKKELIEGLGKEFIRVYEIYRRALLRDANKRPWYSVPEKSKYFFERGAELCVQKNTTPINVLRYWHANIKKVFNGKGNILFIPFITSEAAIHTASTNEVVKEECKSKDGNSFENLNRLDPRLRNVLKKNGFDVDNIDDKVLLSVQYAAISFYEGIDLFVSGKIKKMAKFVAQKMKEGCLDAK